MERAVFLVLLMAIPFFGPASCIEDDEQFLEDLCAPIPADCIPLEPSPCSKTCGMGLLTIEYRCDDGIRSLTGECCHGPCAAAMERMDSAEVKGTGTLGLCRDVFPMCLSASNYIQHPGAARKREVRDLDCTGTAAVQPECVCPTYYSSCDDCTDDSGCEWELVSRSCVPHSFYNIFGYITGNEVCPCDMCTNWANSPAESDLTWLTELNQQFPCPCRAVKKSWSWGLHPVDQPDENWDIDWACIFYGMPFCDLFHPGAYGCLRAVGSTAAGARQQCCYDSHFNLLPPNESGAGTPDKSVVDHFFVDVMPWVNCCLLCEDPGDCQKYKIRRMGDNSHCVTA